eukprot:gb/GEZN01004434.1/.p1 GENE.gb/GEZN01004434.1/~~gb/GEZN01004434.1/.p1  ORF type:complete len:405 (+),score=92.62 gb/GEZN01004434.1/:38-1252(+)
MAKKDDEGSLPKILCYGYGSLPEMSTSIYPDEMVYGLLSLGVGSGTLARTKQIFFTFAGSQVSAVKKGRLNSNKETVLGMMGGASLDYKALNGHPDLEPQLVLDALQKVVTSDHGDVTALSLDVFKAPPEAVEKKVETKGSTAKETVVEKPKEAEGYVRKRQRQPLDFKEALAIVASANGKLDWMIVTGVPAADGGQGTLACVDTGSFGIGELIGALTDDEHQGEQMCAYGFCRLELGSGSTKRFKLCLVSWGGKACPAMARAKHSTNTPAATNIFTGTAFTLTAACSEDLTADIVVEKLQSVCKGDAVDIDVETWRKKMDQAAIDELMKEAAAREAAEAKKKSKITASEGTSASSGAAAPEDPMAKRKAERAKFTRSFSDVLEEVRLDKRQHPASLNWLVCAF